MRLKRLILQGYKTFANKQEFLFDDGITAIVGPNGSGKSNIADALRWALGEQRFGELRGKRGTDMIFAGSEGRSRAGMAQAILTLDNSSGWLPIDYAEVEIGRRTYRSGESEYLINGQKVRLLDVNELLAKAGLSEREYAIIGQGLVDRALSLRAEERRSLFEEAAGITHYKNRRAETLRRLEETQRNLQRVYDILSEIEPRLASLRRQANRAENYERVAVDLRHLLRQYYGFKWREAREELRHARQLAGDAESAWDESRSRMSDILERQHNLKETLAQLRGQERECRQRLDHAREAWGKTQRQAAVVEERKAFLERQSSEIEADLPQLSAQRDESQAELNSAVSELAAAQAAFVGEREEFSKFHLTFQSQQSEIKQKQSTLDDKSRQKEETQNRLARAQGKLSQLRERQQELIGQEISEQEAAQAENAAQQMRGVADEAERATRALRQKRDDMRQTQRQIRKKLGEIRQKIGDINRQISVAHKELGKLEARAELLDQRRLKGVNLPASNGEVKLVGQFAALISIPPQYETAISTALDNRLGALAVRGEADLWALAAEAMESVHLAALDQINPQPLPAISQDAGIIDWAHNIVQAEPDIEPLASLLLGRVALAENKQAAYAFALDAPPGCLAVAPDGFLAHSGGLVETAPPDAANNILAREQAWRDAVAKSEAKRNELGQLQQAGEAILTELEKGQEELEKLQNAEQTQSEREQEKSVEFARLQRQADRAEQQLRFLQRRQSDVAESRLRFEKQVAELESQIEAGDQQTALFEQEITLARADLSALPVAELNQQRDGWQQKLAATQTIIAGRQAVVDSRRSTFNQADGQLQQANQRLARLRQELANLDIQGLQGKLMEQEEELERFNRQLSPIQQRNQEVEGQLQNVEREIAGMQRVAYEHEAALTKTKIKSSQKESALDGLKERIHADLGLVALGYDEDETTQEPLPIAELVETLPDVEELPAEIEREIQKQRGQLRRMGAINPDAPQEYQETQERHQFLSEQVADLEETESQLRGVIAELDELTSRAFSETVEKVNLIFGEMFSTLFGGGSAQLVLTNPDDLTVTGVDILAQLPSRRQQGLALLSGGERSLTAAALIFALLKVSPTPFCVMDEVDAMLDEANISRFVDALRELSLNTQFIVITHNRGTVQAAQTVYGVSMGADSVSRVISIKPDEYLSRENPLL